MGCGEIVVVGPAGDLCQGAGGREARRLSAAACAIVCACAMVRAGVLLALCMVAQWPQLTTAECAAGCSGHGDCDANDACQCYAGYQGADCAARTCAWGRAAADAPAGDLNHDGAVTVAAATAGPAEAAQAYSSVQWSAYKQAEAWPTVAGAPAYAAGGGLNPRAMVGGGWAAVPDEAHFYAECSGAGMCSRATGQCACFDGYEGAACQRAKCPANCNGRGLCKTVGEIAAAGIHRFVGGVGGVNTYAGMAVPAAYRLWDADASTMCVCDAGYEGPDCSQRSCPLGDDPLTDGGALDEVQGFTVSGNANDGGTYALRFTGFDGAAWTTAAFALATNTASSAAMSANAAAIKAALEELPGGAAGAVTAACGSDYSSVPNVRCTVTFTSLPGNVPDLTVLALAGAPVVAQPSQPVHVFAGVVGSSLNVDVGLRLFPEDVTGFRAGQFVGAATTTVDTSADSSLLAAAVSAALQGASTGASAFTYMYGSAGAVVAAGPYGGGSANVVVIMPSRALGAAKSIRLTFNGVSYDSVLDATDGTKETLPCSNRGTCDAAAGVCSCFSGYTGRACEMQNVLAV